MSDRWLEWLERKVGIGENDIVANFAAREGKPGTPYAYNNVEYYYFVHDNKIYQVDEQNPGWGNFKKLKDFSSEEKAVEEFSRMYFKMLSGNYLMTSLNVYGSQINEDINGYEYPVPEKCCENEQLEARVDEVVSDLNQRREDRKIVNKEKKKEFDFSKVVKLSRNDAKELFEKVVGHRGGTLHIMNLKGESYRDLFEERADELDNWISEEYIYGVNDWNNRDLEGYYMIKRGSR